MLSQRNVNAQQHIVGHPGGFVRLNKGLSATQCHVDEQLMHCRFFPDGIWEVWLTVLPLLGTVVLVVYVQSCRRLLSVSGGFSVVST